MAGLDYKLTSRRTHRARGSMRVKGGDGGKTNVLEGAYIDDDRLLQVRAVRALQYSLLQVLQYSAYIDDDRLLQVVQCVQCVQYSAVYCVQCSAV